jgi:hypothetical protein
MITPRVRLLPTVGLLSTLLTFPTRLPADDTPTFWQWAPTPPMGWNSYDAYGDSVKEDEVLANAQAMKDKLLAHGWNYIVVDFRWYDPVPTYNDNELARNRIGAKLAADAFGRLLPAPEKFPSAAGGAGFKPLADQVHAMGLKFGVHMMRGIPRQAVLAETSIDGSTFTAADAGDPTNKCGWCPDMYGVRNNAAGQAWYDSVFRLAAQWGLDFVKVDDLSTYHTEEIEMIRRAIDKCGRPIVLSTSAGPTPLAKADHIRAHANMWRISGDFWDQWPKLNHQFDLLASWHDFTGPGHWPDADMIPFGHISIRNWTGNAKAPKHDRMGRFTPDEEKTLISLWCLGASPLMLGANLPDLDDATLALLTNDEVLAIDQDPLGQAATRVAQQGASEVWERHLRSGATAIGLFNRGDVPKEISFSEADDGLSSKPPLRDLWLHKDIALSFTKCTVPPHGVVLLLERP